MKVRRMISTRLNVGRIPIRVHGWGGLGSQIFACLVAKRLASLFPSRKVVITFHSSGVTHREIEVPKEFIREFVVLTQDDFQTWNKAEKKNDSKLSIKSNIRNRVTQLLEEIGLLARLNTEQEFSNLKTCVYEVRGHYTQVLLKPEEINWVANCLDIPKLQTKERTGSSMVLHLRLGDLLTLKSKSYINLNRLSSAIKSVSPKGKVTIFSDSKPHEVEDLLNEPFNGIDYQVKRESAIKVIQEGSLCDLFIGTNSKISLWIALIRRGLGFGQITLLPTEIYKQLDTLAPKTRNTPRTLEY